MFVGAEFMTWVIRSGTEEGVTLSIIVNAGRRRTEVESAIVGFSGRGMLEAESMSFCVFVSHVVHEILLNEHTPFSCKALFFPTASIILPFSSETSLT